MLRPRPGSTGLQSGDVVVKLDGKPVEDLTIFRNQVALVKPDTKANLTVMRNGESKEIVVTVGTLPDQDVAGVQNGSSVHSLGLTVQTLNAQNLPKSWGSAPTAEWSSPKCNPARKPTTRIKERYDHQASGSCPGQGREGIRRRRSRRARKRVPVLLLVQQGEHTRFVVLKLEK